MWPREGSAGRSVLLRQHPRGPRQRRAVASMGQGPEVTSRQMRRPCSMAVLSLFARGAPPPGLFGCRSGAVGLAGTLTWVRPESKEGSLTECQKGVCGSADKAWGVPKERSFFWSPGVGDGARQAAATLVLSSRQGDGRKRGISWREAMVTSTAVPRAPQTR